MDAYLLLILIGSTLLLITMQPAAFALFGVAFALVVLRLLTLAFAVLSGR